MRSLARKETMLGLRSGSLALNGETTTQPCSLRTQVSRRIEKFFCAKGAAAIRKSLRSKTKAPRRGRRRDEKKSSERRGHCRTVHTENFIRRSINAMQHCYIQIVWLVRPQFRLLECR